MILVIAEQRDGKLNRASWEPIIAAQQTGDPVKVVVLGQGIGDVAAELATAAVSEVLTVEDAALASYTADGYVHALVSLIAAEQPSLVFCSHTYQARDFAPKLAARLDRAIVTDVVASKPHGSGLAFARPMFQAKVYADVVLRGPRAAFRVLPGRRRSAWTRCRRARPRRRSGRWRSTSGRRDPPEARGAVPRSQAGRRPHAGRAHRLGRARHQDAREHRHRQAARRGAARGAVRLAPDLRRRLAAVRAPGRAARARRLRRSSTSPSASPARSSTWSA